VGDESTRIPLIGAEDVARVAANLLIKSYRHEPQSKGSLMRYPPEHKAEVRREIIERAAREFRFRGAEGIGISALMKRLGLTHGGFYRHFRSRESLFTEAVEHGFGQVTARLREIAEAAPPGQKLQQVVRAYLSPEHVDNPGEGCPLAALCTDITRMSARERRRIERPLMNYIDEMAKFVKGSIDRERRRHALLLFSSMAGVVCAARAIPDQQAREDLLQGARQFYMSHFDGTE
jgi:TetR/AcrR family transcriptional repressor of nem operon